MNIRPLFAAALLLAPQVQAAEAPNYFGVLGEYVSPDSSRDAKQGAGVALFYGIPLSPTVAVELRGSDHFLRRSSDRQYDFFYSLGVDLRLAHDYGGFEGYLIGGLGGSYEDYLSDQTVRPYADLGAGLLLPTPYTNLALRGEARYHAVYNKDNRNDRSYGDVLANLGLQFSFGSGSNAAVSNEPRLLDSDDDGVIDTRDRCPGTATGLTVDGQGCPLAATAPVNTDTDNDGIADALDLCPDTAPASTVDGQGCLLAPKAEPVNDDVDGDGIVNSLDKCPGTPDDLKVDSSGCLIEQTAVLPSVQFDSNSDRLTPAAQTTLQQVAESLKQQPNLHVEISGHTDSLGPQSANLGLSQRRAEAVKAFLLKEGLESSRLNAEGYGEFVPVDGNETESGRAHNRRVEFKLQIH